MQALGKTSLSWAMLGQQGYCTCTELLRGTVLTLPGWLLNFSPLVRAIRKFTKENQLSMESIGKGTEQDFSHGT